MTRTIRSISRAAATTAAATVILRLGACTSSVQLPPDNTECFAGICVAIPKAAMTGDFIIDDRYEVD